MRRNHVKIGLGNANFVRLSLLVSSDDAFPFVLGTRCVFSNASEMVSLKILGLAGSDAAPPNDFDCVAIIFVDTIPDPTQIALQHGETDTST